MPLGEPSMCTGQMRLIVELELILAVCWSWLTEDPTRTDLSGSSLSPPPLTLLASMCAFPRATR